MALPALGPRQTAVPASRAISLPQAAKPSERFEAPQRHASRRFAARLRRAAHTVGGWALVVYERATRTTPRSAAITRDICVVGIGVMLALCMAGIGVLVLESDAAVRH